MPRRGEIWWAFVDFAPASPFEVYDGDSQTFERVDADRLADEIRTRRRAPQVDVVVSMKLRTILVIQEPRARIPEYVALKLASLSRLSDHEIAAIRRGEEPSLFHLAAGRHGLERDRAIDLNSLARLNRSAFPSATRVGRVDREVLRAIDERLARYLELDLSGWVKAEASAIVRTIAKGGAPRPE